MHNMGQKRPAFTSRVISCMSVSLLFEINVFLYSLNILFLITANHYFPFLLYEQKYILYFYITFKHMGQK